ncbi:MAG: tetratricopeptide repeat protein, partial [Vicinamibacteria bacterium]
AVECDPDYAEGYRNLAAIQLELGNLDSAVAAMKNAIVARPGDPELQKALNDLLDFQRLKIR